MEKTLYNPLLNYHDDEDAEASIVSNASSHSLRDDWWGRWGKYIIAINIIIPWLLVVACAGILLHYSHPGKDRFRQHKLYPSQLTYSPAQEAIEYKVEVFHQNVESAPSQFQGPPSAELDQAWEDLYQFGLSTIPREQAERLPNLTSPVPTQEDQYIIQLDVFHQLHCLNTLRQAITPFYLSDWEAILSQERKPPTCSCQDADEHNTRAKRHIDITPNHVSHCLESLRQSIMCHGDTAPVVWHWDEAQPKRHLNKGWLSVAHTCRDFNKIKQWALEHQIQVPFDHSVKIPVQFEIPEYP